jgi:uncharacterized protein YjbI with pentapeptide repeats
MDVTNTREVLHVRKADLSESRFLDVKLVRCSFEDVNMRGTSFTNINLQGVRFVDVNMAGVTIEKANLAGMSIDGMLVSDLISAFESRAQTVLHAKRLATLQAFYQGVFGLQAELAESGRVVLASSVQKLILLQAADPPERRTATQTKLVLEVASIATARNTALELGGRLDPVEREWSDQGFRLCDGDDPEGNTLQLRQFERPPGGG